MIRTQDLHLCIHLPTRMCSPWCQEVCMLYRIRPSTRVAILYNDLIISSHIPSRITIRHLHARVRAQLHQSVDLAPHVIPPVTYVVPKKAGNSWVRQDVCIANQDLVLSCIKTSNLKQVSSKSKLKGSSGQEHKNQVQYGIYKYFDSVAISIYISSISSPKHLP